MSKKILSHFEKLGQKLNLPMDVIHEIILAEHSFRCFKVKTTTVTINTTPKLTKQVKRISAALKVSVESVIVGLITSYVRKFPGSPYAAIREISGK